MHTGFRKAVDSKESCVIWDKLAKMEGEDIRSLNDFMLACVVGFDSPEYKKFNVYNGKHWKKK